MTIIKEISAPQAYEIRKNMLRKNIPLTEKIKGDFDESTIHLGVFTEDVLVSVATFLQNDNESFKGLQYRLAGMATKEGYQKKGYGKKLLVTAENILKDRDVSILWCNARVIALNFYKKLGIITLGEEFELPLIGSHFAMYKEL